jgi:hypothetical protein
MGNKYFLLVVIFILTIGSLNGQNSTGRKNPAGTWEFKALSAPEPYTAGTMVVSFADNKCQVFMSFSGSDYKIPAEKVTQSGDSLSFSFFVENQPVVVSLKMESMTNMSGKGVHPGGEVPLTLVRSSSDAKKDLKK